MDDTKVFCQWEQWQVPFELWLPEAWPLLNSGKHFPKLHWMGQAPWSSLLKTICQSWLAFYILELVKSGKFVRWLLAIFLLSWCKTVGFFLMLTFSPNIFTPTLQVLPYASFSDHPALLYVPDTYTVESLKADTSIHSTAWTLSCLEIFSTRSVLVYSRVLVSIWNLLSLSF